MRRKWICAPLLSQTINYAAEPVSKHSKIRGLKGQSFLNPASEEAKNNDETNRYFSALFSHNPSTKRQSPSENVEILWDLKAQKNPEHEGIIFPQSFSP